MLKVNIPTKYKSNVSYTFRNDRKRWVLRYTLPYEKKEVIITQTLPTRFTKKQEKAVKKIVLEKVANLEKGKLTDKEFKRLQSLENTKKIRIEDAISEFHSLPGVNKTPSTVESEKRSIIVCLNYFKDEFKLKNVNDVQKKHIKAFKIYLLSRSKSRQEKLEFSKKLKAVTSNESQKYQIDLEVRKSGISPATARSYFRDCMTLFNKLFKHERININPIEGIESIVVPKSQRVRSKVYSLKDVVAILEAPYQHSEGFPLKEFFELKMELGPRYGELINLEWDEIDLENKTIRLDEKPLCPTPLGLGFKPKSGSSRTIQLSDRAIKILESIPRRKSVGYVKYDNTPYPANFVFVSRDFRKKSSPNYGGWCRPNSIKTAWKSLLKAAGLPHRGIDKFCFHDLRRFRNEVDRHLYQMSDSARSEKLGHSVKVNKEHYSPSRFDEKITSLTTENNSLKRENMLLRERISNLKE